MNLTAYHAKYFAHELTRRCPSGSVEKLAGALVDAQADLNPHQVDAALFAFRSPLSKGAILADEVGLGKTIEAGLVISQKWAERRRRILVITTSNLRKQWHQELTEKFFLPCRILETKFYNEAVRSGDFFPFCAADIIICSYQFARNKAADIKSTPWDLVVIDEAHRLRNVYKPANIIANTLKEALKDAPKLLLTATPLKNSLLELYGLVSFADARVFGDLSSIRREAIQHEISQRNAAFFEAEADKLDSWADDLKIGLEREIKELDREIKEARRAATAALSLEAKLAGQRQVKALEAQRNAKRRALFDAQDDIDRQRGLLIAEIEGKLQQRTSLKELFVVRWRLQ